MNGKHYTIAARLFKKLPARFQKFGTKIHFNWIKTEEGENLRYGVIRKKDLINDLDHWETLATASFMQRPHTVLVNDDQVQEFQLDNLRSAAAFAALRTVPNASADEFYKSIIRIPHYQSSRFFTLMD